MMMGMPILLKVQITHSRTLSIFVLRNGNAGKTRKLYIGNLRIIVVLQFQIGIPKNFPFILYLCTIGSTKEFESEKSPDKKKVDNVILHL